MDIDNPTQTASAATLPRLLSVDEAAELLAVSSSTIHNWIRDESIPYIKLPGGSERTRYRIPLQGLLNSLSGNYDLGGELARLNEAAAATSEAGMDVRAELRKRRSKRSGGDRPRQMVDGRPSDVFEHAAARST
jgi:excisionase family DNA binding protein